MSHLDDEDVLRFLGREQTGPQRRRSTDHVRRCAACRARVEAESRFDQDLRHRLSYARAPERLLAAVRDDIAHESRRRRARGAVWISSGAAAAAVLLALVLALVPITPSRLSEGLVASGATTGIRQIHGRLVCVGCTRLGVAIERQRSCAGGHDDHVTGLQDDDGRLWQFMDGDASAPLVNDPDRRGQRVQVSARLYENIDHMRVFAARTL